MTGRLGRVGTICLQRPIGIIACDVFQHTEQASQIRDGGLGNVSFSLEECTAHFVL